MISRHIANSRKIFLAGVEAVKPKNIFSNHSQFKFDKISEVLTIQNVEFPTANKSVHMVGFGKAVFLMAAEIEKLLSSKLSSGLVNIPLGTRLKYPDQKLQVTSVLESAENNLPDENSVQAAKEIISKVTSMSSNDILIVLISGGGSALLPLPKEGVTLEDKLLLIKKLQAKGADIKELNAVRIGLSASKGGKLGQAAAKCHQVIGLIISDIVNDPVDLIASGPTVRPLLNGREVLEKYGLWKDLPGNVQNLFNDKFEDSLENVRNFVLANNKLAVDSCVKQCQALCYEPLVLSTNLEGEVGEVSRSYGIFLEGVVAYRDRKISDTAFLVKLEGLNFLKPTEVLEFLNKNLDKDICFIASGETTVNIRGSGKGGRNQEISLQMSKMFRENNKFKDFIFLSAGTDGIDGPTDVAGAIGVKDVAYDIEEAEKSLSNNDSYHYFEKLDCGKYVVKTGHTGTNVMDIHLIILPK